MLCCGKMIIQRRRYKMVYTYPATPASGVLMKSWFRFVWAWLICLATCWAPSRGNDGVLPSLDLARKNPWFFVICCAAKKQINNKYHFYFCSKWGWISSLHTLIQKKFPTFSQCFPCTLSIFPVFLFFFSEHKNIIFHHLYPSRAHTITNSLC